MPQHHSLDDDRRHMEFLAQVFDDPRYIRVDGRPLFLVYRTELLPDPAITATVWREQARLAGIGEIYLARVEGFQSGTDPSSIGFDAAVEFAPDWRLVRPLYRRERWDLRARIQNRLRRAGLLSEAYWQHHIASYGELMRGMLEKPVPPYRQLRCVTPGWDNSARRARDAVVLVGATPENYGMWLRTVVEETSRRPNAAEHIIFINAWNEWAEACHLEPDQRWGHAFLEATRHALALPADRVGASLDVGHRE